MAFQKATPVSIKKLINPVDSSVVGLVIAVEIFDDSGASRVRSYKVEGDQFAAINAVAGAAAKRAALKAYLKPLIKNHYDALARTIADPEPVPTNVDAAGVPTILDEVTTLV